MLKGRELGFDVLLLSGVAPFTLLEGLDWCLSWFVLLLGELSELAFIQRAQTLKLSEAGVNVIINSASDTTSTGILTAFLPIHNPLTSSSLA